MHSKLKEMKQILTCIQHVSIYPKFCCVLTEIDHPSWTSVISTRDFFPSHDYCNIQIYWIYHLSKNYYRIYYYWTPESYWIFSYLFGLFYVILLLWIGSMLAQYVFLLDRSGSFPFWPNNSAKTTLFGCILARMVCLRSL